MPAQSLRAVGAALLLGLALSPALAEDTSKTDAFMRSVQDGFRSTTELKEVDALVADEKFEEAFVAVTEVIEQASKSAPSSRRARFVGAEALMRRAEIRQKLLHDNLKIIADENAAAELGSVRAMYHYASRIILLHSPGEQQGIDIGLLPPIAAAKEMYRRAAFLGDLTSADLLTATLVMPHEFLEKNYWGFLQRVNADLKKFASVHKDFEDVLTPRDFTLLRAAVDRYGLSEIDGLVTTPSLPGRSVFVAYQNDYWLRRRLAFAWRAFFAENQPSSMFTIADTFDAERSVVAVEGLSDLYLIVPGAAGTVLPNLVVIEREATADAISAGDEIMVRCGSDDHKATVWSVDREKRIVHIVDPFYEFWKPDQTPCTPSFDLIEFTSARQLIKLDLDEVVPMVLAIFTLRDPL